jgi:V8-like Glu-specific endopeptidase
MRLSLLLLETAILASFTTLLPVSLASHLRRVVETQESNNPNEVVEDTMGPLIASYMTNDVTPLQASPRIIGGTITDPGEYPYFATTASRMCGASLIHPDILLTAAHCQKVLAKAGVVFVGAHKLDALATAAEKRTLIRQYPHPDSDFFEPKGDLMLFQLDQPIATLPVVTLNADPDLPSLDSSTLTVIGFGTTLTTRLSDSLQEVDVYPVDPDTCVRQYNETATVDPATMLCAGDSLPNHDSCSGDSGGPLLDKATGEQVGIVSFGKGCGDPDFPGVYTRVSTYASWIQDRICELSAVPPANCPPPNSKSKSKSTTGELIKVSLYIQYDNNPTESFWRLEDNATGQTIAFQPSLPERGAAVSQVLMLPPGKYTLQFTDADGDGICCRHGQGKVVISVDPQQKDMAQVSDVLDGVEPRIGYYVKVLADSDGVFKSRLSLAFVIPSSADLTNTNTNTAEHENENDAGDDENDGCDIETILIVTIPVIAVLSLMVALLLAFTLRSYFWK